MGGLGHYFESEGIASTQISLVRVHTENIKPPRALWVPFELGRPFGAPHDPEFQLSVLRKVLGLTEHKKGPVLEDFPEDAPDSKGSPAPVVCPVSFQKRDDAKEQTSNWSEDFKTEIRVLSNWYEVSKEIRNRTTAGVSGLDVEESADLLIRFVEEETRGTVIDEGKVVDRIRRACEDLKAYYYESVSAQPGQPTDSQSLSNWFWGETRAAWVINRIREICLEEPESKHAILGKLLLVPRTELHRFQ